MGGGRRFFVPHTLIDEEGVCGARTDNRDLRNEVQTAGYRYVWNKTGFDGLPALGLFESGHMEYEFDRPATSGGSQASRT